VPRSRVTRRGGTQALSNHPEKEVQRQADSWLQQFQGTQEAWQVSDALLHLPDSPMEVQYFCAQTLKKKAQRDFEELPEGAAPCASPPSP
jgi:transportin-3